jgi:lysophospholipase L1-like esterase
MVVYPVVSYWNNFQRCLSEATIVTLTVGGNDFLSSWGPGGAIDRGAVEYFRANLKKILEVLCERSLNCTIILGTIYDPMDGAGDLNIPRVDIQEATNTMAGVHSLAFIREAI